MQTDTDDDSVETASVHFDKNSLNKYVFTAHYTRPADYATLNIKAEGVSFGLQDTTHELFDARCSKTPFHFEDHLDSGHYVVNFNSAKEKKHEHWSGSSDSVNIKLNPQPVWDINMNAGAADVNFDFSKFKVRSIKMDGGAGEFKIRLGQPLEETRVTTTVGAADLTIEVPTKAACRIHINSGLSSNTFEGFEKKSDDIYETPNFAAAKNKTYINMSGAVSDFKVRKY